MPGFPALHSLPMPSNHLLSRPLLLLPSIFLSIRVFSNELALRIGWSKYWSSSFSICPPSEYSGLISFRVDWFYLPAVQGTLKSLLQLHSWKVSILWLSALLYIHTNTYICIIYIYTHIFGHSCTYIWAFLVAQMVKNLPALWETQALSLNREDPLEKGMVTQFGLLAWRIPWTEEPSRLLSIESQSLTQLNN